MCDNLILAGTNFSENRAIRYKYVPANNSILKVIKRSLLAVTVEISVSYR